jgi:hypothetical protein
LKSLLIDAPIIDGNIKYKKTLNELIIPEMLRAELTCVADVVVAVTPSNRPAAAAIINNDNKKSTAE